MSATAVPQVPPDPDPTPARTLGDLSSEELYSIARKVAAKQLCSDPALSRDDVAQDLWLFLHGLQKRRPDLVPPQVIKAAWREALRDAKGEHASSKSIRDAIMGDPEVARLPPAEQRALVQEAQRRSRRATRPSVRMIALNLPEAQRELARMARSQVDVADAVAERLDDRARLGGELREHFAAEMAPLDEQARDDLRWRIQTTLDGRGAGGPAPDAAGLARSKRVLGRIQDRAAGLPVHTPLVPWSAAQRPLTPEQLIARALGQRYAA